MFCQQHTLSPCHCPEIMWALKCRNTRISSDFVMRFLRHSLKRPQTEKMRSTKACDAGALIRPCAKGASPSTGTLTQASAVSKTAMDLTLSGCCATRSGTCSFQRCADVTYHAIVLRVQTLRTTAREGCRRWSSCSLWLVSRRSLLRWNWHAKTLYLLQVFVRYIIDIGRVCL